MEAHQKSRFFDFLLASNRPSMQNFEKWVLQPGMLFNSLEQWWGKNKKRETPHEGIDLCRFQETNGRINRIGNSTKIPATFAGSVVKIDDDFLGKSVYLSHDIFSQDRRRLYTVYGHTTPLAAIKPGEKVAAGETIAVVSGPGPRGTDILPHLHLTFAWIPVSLDPGHLTWQNLARDPRITLMDPLEVLSPPVIGIKEASRSPAPGATG
jgi:murein DD-endopeptidase MepM/ murein hydrolase activator NlpD